jgi:hypothetical protein
MPPASHAFAATRAAIAAGAAAVSFRISAALEANLKPLINDASGPVVRLVQSSSALQLFRMVLARPRRVEGCPPQANGGSSDASGEHRPPPRESVLVVGIQVGRRIVLSAHRDVETRAVATALALTHGSSHRDRWHYFRLTALSDSCQCSCRSRCILVACTGMNCAGPEAPSGVRRLPVPLSRADLKSAALSRPP